MPRRGEPLEHRGGGLVHAQVVEVDAGAARLADRLPIGALEAVFGVDGDLPEEAVVLVEAVEDGGGDFVGQALRQRLGRSVRHAEDATPERGRSQPACAYSR